MEPQRPPIRLHRLVQFCTGYAGTLDPDTEFKALAFTVTTFFTLVILALFAALSAKLGRGIDAIVMLAPLPLLVWNVLLCRRSGALVRALHRMVMIIFPVAAFLVIREGGTGPTSWWLIMPAFIFISASLYRAGFVAFGIALVFMIGVEAARMADWLAPADTGVMLELQELLSRIGFFTAILLALFIINRLRSLAYRRILEMNDALSRANQQANAAAEAKSRFLATMSHEIRTPLHGLLSAAELLTRSSLNPEQARLIGILQQSGGHLGELVNAVLDFSKAESGKLEVERRPFDLRELVEDVVDTHTLNAHAKGLVLSALIPPELPATVVGDTARLRQLLNNLIGNAIKFTASGQVGVEVGVDVSTEQLTFAVWDTGVGIPESALGRVFDPFTQADESITRLYGGSGLGLAICAELVRAMGGHLSVTSELEQGSKFAFSLPLATDAALQPAEEAFCEVLILDPLAPPARALTATARAVGCRVVSNFRSRGLLPRVALVNARVWNDPRALADLVDLPADCALILVTTMGRSVPKSFTAQTFSEILREPLRGQLLRSALDKILKSVSGEEFAPPVRDAPESMPSHALSVLLVEDNAVNQLLARSMLENFGCTVVTADNGLQAVEMWHRQSFDVVLMDCQMPVLDGLAATRRIREVEKEEQRPRTHIVALTANAFVEDRASCVAAGMDEFLAKPFTAGQLSDLLRQQRQTLFSERRALG